MAWIVHTHKKRKGLLRNGDKNARLDKLFKEIHAGRLASFNHRRPKRSKAAVDKLERLAHEIEMECNEKIINLLQDEIHMLYDLCRPESE